LTNRHFSGRQQEALVVTRVWQKWRFSAPQTHLWLIKHWFSESTFVVKIATFAKPETVKIIFPAATSIFFRRPKKQRYCTASHTLHASKIPTQPPPAPPAPTAGQSPAATSATQSLPSHPSPAQ
jgi:hypothetical protein